MPSPRKPKRTRNPSAAQATTSRTQLCGVCESSAKPDESSYRQSRTPAASAKCLPRTVSAGTATTAASSLSAYSAQLTALEREVCPVTGVYANVDDDYRVSPDRVLGKGHYGVVRECIHRATGQSFAIKSIDKSRIGRLDHLQREIFLLANVDHRAIARMVDCYEDAECVHIVTEKYAGGELFDRVIKEAGSHGCFSERRAGRIIKSLLEAVAYLHDNGVVHRDIKPENVLFESKDEDAPVRLVDFGLARQHARGEEPMTNPVGTAYYMSPELLNRKYDNATDVWSVGVVAYILLCGHAPFNGANDAEIHNATRKNPLQFRGKRWTNKSDEAIDFVESLLRKDPRRRVTAREALGHPWIRNMTTS